MFDDLAVASSTIKTLSAESGIVTVLLAARVPVNLKYKFLPFDTAWFDNAKATSLDATSIAIYPLAACSNICRFVFVIVPQVPDFSPVVISSSFKSLVVPFGGARIAHSLFEETAYSVQWNKWRICG